MLSEGQFSNGFGKIIFTSKFFGKSVKFGKYPTDKNDTQS